MRRFQKALAVAFEEAAGVIERFVLTEAGEGIGEEAVRAGGVEGRIRSEEGEIEVSGEIMEEAVSFFLPSPEMAVKGDRDISGAEVVFESGGGG